MNSKVSISNGNARCSVQQFLVQYLEPKGNPNNKIITNTRIPGSKGQVLGGSYSIPDDKYNEFLEKYQQDILDNNLCEHLTEKQLDNNGALLVDLDLKYDINVNKRLHTKTHIEDLIDDYLCVISNAYKMDSNTRFKAFVMEKQNINKVEKINKTKDGIHLIFTLSVDRATQVIMRNKVINEIKEQWSDLPITNSWEEVFDEGITLGHCPWQLYGSKKPDNEPYRITYIYDISFDASDGECIRKNIDVKDYKLDIKELSIRNTNHLKLEMKESFVNEHSEVADTISSRRMKRVISGGLNKNTILDDINLHCFDSIKSIEDLNELYENFIDNIPQEEYYLKETTNYVMALSEKYYGTGSYDNWIRVCWALKNTSKKLLIVWIKFSSRSETFCINTDMHDLIEKWNSSPQLESGGITRASLVHWLRLENPSKVKEIEVESVSYYIDQTIYGIEGSQLTERYEGGEVELAVVLYQLYKNEYVCTSHKANHWYRYTGHRWKFVESGHSLRKAISEELRNLYMKRSVQKSKELSAQIDNPNLEEAERQKSAEKRKLIGRKIINIIQTLNKTQKKDGIMKEAKELFYDSEFTNKLDTNPHLICFKNGVFDFKEKIFRHGKPDDYLSMCTNIDYKPLSEDTKKIESEVNNFMSQLFPRCSSLKEYVWSHLASTLMGTTDCQTFNMYIGKGQNGKSVLVSLMEKVLGDYKGDVPISLITEKRQKVGGLSPEVAALKGKRYALMQEPSKNDVINEGPLKQYTSGEDTIQGRALYSDNVAFKPQMKLVVTTNHFMAINAQDHGTWRRIRVIPFESLFTENPVDNDKEKPYQFKLDTTLTREKFPLWKEIFASMLIEKACQTNGLVKDCDIVLENSRAYRATQDHVSAFVNEKVIKDKNAKIEKNEINYEFKQWWLSNYGEKKMPSPKDVHEHLDKNYGKCKNGEWGGLKIKYNQNTSETFDGDDINDINISDL